MRTGWIARGTILSGLVVAGLALGATGVLAQGPGGGRGPAPAPQGQGSETWDRQAEQTFMLGPGMGRRLMTQEEWAEHQEKMRTMTPQEREQYRQEMHARMQQRAREKGIALPDVPRGPMSGAPGRGMGPGGAMGPGRGMGPGGAMGPGWGQGPGAGAPGGGADRTQ
ncbi:MAG TPA: hypothetical protein VF406_02105 [Thermodesulfobacteriota bacterium]